MSLVRVYIYIASYIVYRNFCFLYFVLSYSYYELEAYNLHFMNLEGQSFKLF